MTPDEDALPRAKETNVALILKYIKLTFGVLYEFHVLLRKETRDRNPKLRLMRFEHIPEACRIEPCLVSRGLGACLGGHKQHFIAPDNEWSRVLPPPTAKPLLTSTLTTYLSPYTTLVHQGNGTEYPR